MSHFSASLLLGQLGGIDYFRSPNSPLDALAVGLKWRNGNFGGSGVEPLLRGGS